MKIGVVTGSRAEYGLLRGLIREIAAEPRWTLQLVVTGAHLSAEHGYTVAEIEADGFPIAARVDLELSGDTPMAIGRSMGIGLAGLSEAFDRLRPDLLVLLGDRYEILAAASAAAVARIPVAHLHGGERTEGAMDDAFRHAITKLSHLHFTATEEYRRRVCQLGEDPTRVFSVGALGLDAIRTVPRLSRSELETALGIRFRPLNLLVTFHPATLDADASGAQCVALLDALGGLDDVGLWFTGANADPYGKVINARLGEFVARRGASALFPSLGQQRYLSMLGVVDAVIGNSSSGLLEAPSFGIPTVNVGNRQRGRVRADSVLDCEPTAASIGACLAKALSPGFREYCRSVVNPYGDGHAVDRIVEVLRSPLSADLLYKRFHDVG